MPTKAMCLNESLVSHDYSLSLMGKLVRVLNNQSTCLLAALRVTDATRVVKTRHDARALSLPYNAPHCRLVAIFSSSVYAAR